MSKYIASYLKDMNRKRVFDLLSVKREMSKAEIARELGISVQTVIKIIDFLVANSLVLDLGEGSASLGRKPQMYGFNPNAAHVVGIIYEGRYIYAGVVNLDGEVLKMIQSEMIGNDVESVIIGQTCDIALALLEEMKGDDARMIGIGIGLPGVVDDEKLELSYASNLHILLPVSLRYILSEFGKRVNLPILIENDVNAAAYGEYIARKYETNNLVFLSLGTGLGSGIILDGKLLCGERNLAGEIGYMVYGEDFDSECPRNIEDTIRLSELKKKWGFDLHSGVEAMEPEAREAMLNFISSMLACCIGNMAITMDVSTFVLGGVTVMALGENLFSEVCRKVQRSVPFPTKIYAQGVQNPGISGVAMKVFHQKIDKLLAE